RCALGLFPRHAADRATGTGGGDIVDSTRWPVDGHHGRSRCRGLIADHAHGGAARSRAQANLRCGAGVASGRTGMKLIAQRGGGGLRVENTLAAFAHEIELGADGAELDVHLSADDQTIVHHDARLNSGYCRHPQGDWISTGERMPLSALSAAQLQAYDIGTPQPGTDYARAFDRIEPQSGQRIPLLREVIELAKARSNRFFLLIEIKASLPSDAAQALQAVADAALAVIEQTGFVERSILCSFDWRTLRHIKTQWP